MGWLSKLIVVDNLGCPKYKQNFAEFLVDFKKHYPQIKNICWDLLTLIKSYSRVCYRIRNPKINLIQVCWDLNELITMKDLL